MEKRKNTSRKRYVWINGALFKIELIEGTPPPMITIATQRGLNAVCSGQRNTSIAFQNRDLANVTYSNFHYVLPEKNIKKNE